MHLLEVDLGDSIHPQHGFSHWFCHPQGSGPYNDQPMIRDGKLIPTEGYITDIISEESCSFISSHKDEPFCLQVHFTAPHSPWTGHPLELLALYDGCPFNTCPQEPRHPWAGPLTKSSLGNREYLKGYFAAVTAMDRGIGRIIGTLEESGILENTLIIFTSDNGFSCGHHGFWGKGNGTFPLNMYENSIRVPLIVSQIGKIPHGLTHKAMISQYDILPTILAYLDLENIYPSDCRKKFRICFHW